MSTKVPSCEIEIVSFFCSQWVMMFAFFSEAQERVSCSLPTESTSSSTFLRHYNESRSHYCCCCIHLHKWYLCSRRIICTIIKWVMHIRQLLLLLLLFYSFLREQKRSVITIIVIEWPLFVGDIFCVCSCLHSVA